MMCCYVNVHFQGQRFNLCDIEVYGAVEVNFHTLLSLIISFINDVCGVGINITYDFGGVYVAHRCNVGLVCCLVLNTVYRN